MAAIPALHAAALQGDDFRTVKLRGMINSWEDVVRATENYNQMVNTVHGALQHYDLTDLIQLVGTNRVVVTDTVTPAAIQ